MAFTPYLTFVAANTLTAAQLNQQLRDNGNFLLNGKFVASKYYLKGTGDYTLTMPQATWTNVDSTNLQLTTPNTFSSGRVRVTISLTAAVSYDASNLINENLDISIDNKAFSGSGSVNANGVATATPLAHGLVTIANNVTYQNAATIREVTMIAVITGLTTGVTHTFEPMYTTSRAGGTGSAYILGTTEPYYIIVEEL